MRNRNSGLGLFLLFFFLFGGGFGLLTGLIGLFFEIGIPILMGYGIYKMIKAMADNIKEKQKENRINSYRDSTKNFSNSERSRIDRKLKEYFRDHYSLPVYEDIALTTQNGTFTAVENLLISVGEEKILSLSDFRAYYPAMYNKIVDLLLAFSKQNEEVMAADVKTPEIKQEDKLSDAQKYIDKINELNTAIPNEEVTNGLYQTCALLKKIDLAVKDDKDRSKLDKLYDYYLPILTGILENYRSLQQGTPDSKEFKESETQLIKTIILINEALKTMNEQLHEADYMNLSADITTLQSLLKKDGLVDNDPFGQK
ncbi:MAG: 5-bromo-4-chloroindolyl phosphate hydrolysis family protein [Erysipelotrichaceae bacterium]|nr:5-bromo-4-chloroindolyl phosphate hydrolysis family protein [Erysipelotrichaceae bacterium]